MKADLEQLAGEYGFVVKHQDAVKAASIAYCGPFPHQPMNGWGIIRWEQRAKDKGLVYTERLYRELYHAFDFEGHRHIAEIQKDRTMTTSPIFVFHTLQHGYPLQADLGSFLGEPVGRYRTVQPYPLAVYREASCQNERCGFEHRVCGLLNRPGEGHRVEGDIYELDDEQLRLLDIEEFYLPDQPKEEQGSVRRVIELEPIDGGAPVRAETHFNDSHEEHYTHSLEEGWAELVACYTIEMAQQTPKACCVETPGHPGLHTISPSHCHD